MGQYTKIKKLNIVVLQFLVNCDFPVCSYLHFCVSAVTAIDAVTTMDRRAEAQAFVEQVTGEPFAHPEDFQASLKDGVLLCKLFNSLHPGSIPKISSSKMPFMQMENIDSYIKACESVGIPSHYNFMTVDLYEGKNLEQVALNIVTLKRESGYGFHREGRDQRTLVDLGQDQSTSVSNSNNSEPSEEYKFQDSLSRTGAALRPGQERLNDQVITPICASCGLHVTTGCIHAMDAHWHSKCFTCKKCGTVLSRSTYFPNEGKAYCQRCILIINPQNQVRAQ